MRNVESNLSYNTLLNTRMDDICTSGFKLYNAFLEAKVTSKICKCWSLTLFSSGQGGKVFVKVNPKAYR